MALGHTTGPMPELGPGPLKVVARVAFAPGNHAVQHVVFLIRRGHQHQARAHAGKHGALDPGQVAGRDVLDGLQHHRGIEAFQLGIHFFKGAQPHRQPRVGLQPVQAQSSACIGQRAGIDVDAQQAHKLRVFTQTQQQLARPAPEVEHAGRATVLQRTHHRVKAFNVQQGGHSSVTFC